MEKKKIAFLGALGVIAVVGAFILFAVGIPVGEATVQSVSGPSEADEGNTVELCTEVKNEQPFKVDYMVEMGVIPDSVASEWFPQSFSFLGGNSEGQCCTGQENIMDRWVSLGPHETKEVCSEVTVPYEGIQDKCGNTNYHSDSGDYSRYYMISNHCNYRDGQDVEGFELYDVEIESLDTNSGIFGIW